jgi:hypothetical protein
MPKTKMTKGKWALVVLLMFVLGATAIHRSIASNQTQDHQHHQQTTQTQKGKPNPQTPIIDGAVDPNAIPDVVAYEHFFNSITNDAGAAERDIARANYFVDRIGLVESKKKIVIEKANSYRGEVKSFDAEAKALKDHNWPNPSDSVKAQLKNLQTRKERLLRKQYFSLLEQLTDTEKGKLRLQIQEVKSKVKVYQPLPVEKFQK